jgi:preprotein translocase subunit SecF
VLELVPPGTQIDFIGHRRIAYAISGALLLAGIVAVAVQGMRFGIDFAGGTEVAVRFARQEGVDEAAIRAIVESCGVQDPTVVRYGETSAPEFLVRFNRVGDTNESECPSPAGGEPAAAPAAPAGREAAAAPAAEAPAADAPGAPAPERLATSSATAVVDRLTPAMRAKLGELDVLSVDYVGPQVGDDLRRDGLKALGIATLGILAYIAYRFSSRFGPGAVVALVHDVLITAGIFAIFQLEFDLSVLAALLGLMGYSLNDTVIVYDRIRENMATHTKLNLEDVLNRSVNETLSRTLLTSLNTLATVLCLLFLGGEVIFGFALAMVIGIVVGTYSSIFVAAPILLFLEQRFGGGAKDTKSTGKPGRPGPSGGKKLRAKAQAA